MMLRATSIVHPGLILRSARSARLEGRKSGLPDLRSQHADLGQAEIGGRPILRDALASLGLLRMSAD